MDEIMTTWKITETMTTPSKPGKQPRPVWVISGMTVGYEEALREAGGRKFRGQWSFFSDPTDLLPTLQRQSFGERIEAQQERASDRADRREEWADKATQRSSQAHARARAIGDMIPSGQPILVDHYSAKRHRADINRIDNAMRKAVTEADKAEHHARMARVARATAEGDHSVAFMSRRLKEAEAELRRVLRKLGSDAQWSPENRLKIETLRDEYQEKVNYWQAQIVAKSGVQYTKQNVAKGDRVRYRGTWYEVARVNAQTVTVCGWLGIPHVTWKVAYAAIEAHEKAA